MQGLRDNVLKHAKDGYEDKTLLFCWEHKAIPQIVQYFGLTKDELTWGLNPFSGVGYIIPVWTMDPAQIC